MTEQTVQVGERLAVSYDISNRGQSDGEQTVELTLDGEVADSEALVLDTGEKDRMSLVTDAFTDEDDGQLYEVEIVTDDRVAQVMTVEVTAITDVLVPQENDLDQFIANSGDPDTDFAINSESPVIFTDINDLSLKQTSDVDDTDDLYIHSTEGLENYPEAGKKFAWFWRDESGEDSFSLTAFGVQDASNFYGVTLSTANDEIRIHKDDPQGGAVLNSEPVTINSNQWFDVEVEWATDGSITATVFSVNSDSSRDSELQSVTASDSEYSGGGIGFGGSSSGVPVVWDYYRITGDL